jgi:hypothetical protein
MAVDAAIETVFTRTTMRSLLSDSHSGWTFGEKVSDLQNGLFDPSGVEGKDAIGSPGLTPGAIRIGLLRSPGI